MREQIKKCVSCDNYGYLFVFICKPTVKRTLMSVLSKRFQKKSKVNDCYIKIVDVNTADLTDFLIWIMDDLDNSSSVICLRKDFTPLNHAQTEILNILAPKYADLPRLYIKAQSGLEITERSVPLIMQFINDHLLSRTGTVHNTVVSI